jgi:chromosome segregation ATPase
MRACPLAAFILVGCADPQQRLDQLQQQVEQLRDDLNARTRISLCPRCSDLAQRFFALGELTQSLRAALTEKGNELVKLTVAWEKLLADRDATQARLVAARYQMARMAHDLATMQARLNEVTFEKEKLQEELERK